MENNRYYVGLTVGNRTVFQSATVPTFDTHGDTYNAVIGPFVTKRGAEFMAQYGAGNPHCQTVSDAERLAQQYSDPRSRVFREACNHTLRSIGF